MLTTDDNKLPWDSLLFEQRKSVATINFAGTISDTTDLEKLLIMNFKTALSTKNYDLANKALFKMQESNIYPSKMLFEDAVFKSILTVPQITQNVAALLNGTYRSDMPKAIEFLFCWLNEDKDLSVATKHNFINLYTLLSEELLNNWDISAKRLSNVIHPSVIRRLMDDGIESELLLNLNLTFIKYFGQVNDGPNISKAFDYIVDYFSAGELEIEDDIKLALFFNHWSRYDLTKKHLLSNFDKVALSEEAIFILLQTLFFYTENGDDAEMFEKVYLKALDINQKKWCLWVDTSFQILRNQKLKVLYCDKCFSN